MLPVVSQGPGRAAGEVTWGALGNNYAKQQAHARTVSVLRRMVTPTGLNAIPPVVSFLRCPFETRIQSEFTHGITCLVSTDFAETSSAVL